MRRRTEDYSALGTLIGLACIGVTLLGLACIALALFRGAQWLFSLIT